MKKRPGRALICLLLVAITVSCNKGSQPTVQAPAQVTQPAKRYHLKGKVVSIDKQAKMVNIDSEAIPDFMDAMTAPNTPAYTTEAAMDPL